MKSKHTHTGYKGPGGFSVLELLIVVAVIAVVAAIAVPPILSTLAGFRLRSAAAGMENLIQDTRMRSVRDDAAYSVAQVTLGGGTTAYCIVNQPAMANPAVPVAADCFTTEPTFVVPNNVQIIPEAQAPAVVPETGNANYFQDANPTDWPSFTARGLPCLYPNGPGACSTLPPTAVPAGAQVGFVYYLASQLPSGALIYRAVTVSPAGRVKLWAYSGGKWQ